MNKILVLILTVAISGFTQNFRQMGSNYYAYPTPTAKYTKAKTDASVPTTAV